MPWQAKAAIGCWVLAGVIGVSLATASGDPVAFAFATCGWLLITALALLLSLDW